MVRTLVSVLWVTTKNSSHSTDLFVFIRSLVLRLRCGNQPVGQWHEGKILIIEDDMM
jgi:hypothetical protein